MKNFLLVASLFTSTLLLSGCTSSDWIQAAGGIMQAKDDYGKKSRSERIKRANAAAARARYR